MGSLWVTDDDLTQERLNRLSIVGRLLMPIYDVDNSSTVTVTPVAVDGDDVVTTETEHYEVPSGAAVAVVQRITLCNTNSSANQVSVHLVKSGGSRAVSNRIWSASLQPGETVVLEGPFFLGPGGTIRSISSGASANEVSLRADVLEFDDMPEGLNLPFSSSGKEGAALTASTATYYTAPANAKTVVLHVLLCNTDDSAQGVTVYLVESGGSAAGQKALFATDLLPGETVMIVGPFALDAGDTIQAVADEASVVAIRVTPVEMD